MSAPIPPLDEAGVNNYIDARNLLLAAIANRMTKEAADALTPTEIAQLTNAVAAIGKIQIAAHRAQTADRRADTAELRARTAEARVQAITKTHADKEAARDPRYGKPTRREDDHEAPYGRKKDGTPYTPTEFRESLQEAVNDIYGITLDDALIHPERHPEGLYAEPNQKPYDPIHDSAESNEPATDQACRLASEYKTAPDPACRFAERDCSKFDPEKSNRDPITTREPDAEKSTFRNHPVPPPAYFRKDALPHEPSNTASSLTHNKSPPH